MKIYIVTFIFATLLEFSFGSEQTKNCSGSGIKGYRIIHCPLTWARYKQEKCFKIYWDNPQDQQNAQLTCFGENAVLASLHSADELEFIKSYILREVPSDKLVADTWIGGMLKGKTFWTWLDLSRFDYSDWTPGEPKGGNEECVKLITHFKYIAKFKENYGRMQSGNCNNSRLILCQQFQVDTRVVSYDIT